MTAPVFSVRGGSATLGSQTLLEDIDLDLPDHAISVFLGPGGSRKTTLLQILAGFERDPQLVRLGTWMHRGQPIPSRGNQSSIDIAWLPQPAPSWNNNRALVAGSGTARTLAEALDAGSSTLLLDEPQLRFGEVELERFSERLRRRRESGSVVLVTHNLALARSVADYVVLLFDGRIAGTGPAESFFSNPPNAMAAQFLAQGNCALPVADLPGHFRWVVPGKIAAMARPGLLAPLDEELRAIAREGVEIVVSLTEEPLSREAARSAGLETRHLAIPDMGVPAVGAAASLCRDLERALKANRAIVVHCHGGLGRTGLMIAALLIWLGDNAEDAIAKVRASNRNAIQTAAQEEFVHRFAREFAVPQENGTT